MNISPSRAKRLARRLLRENRKYGRSWRSIAHEDFKDRIHNATLCRFAITKGTWMPKDKDMLIVLGLIKPRAPRRVKTLKEMTRNEMIEYFNRNVMRMNEHLQVRNIKLSIEWVKGK